MFYFILGIHFTYQVLARKGLGYPWTQLRRTPSGTGFGYRRMLPVRSASYSGHTTQVRFWNIKLKCHYMAKPNYINSSIVHNITV